MADARLQGKHIAIIATDMVEQVELVEPRKALENAGAKTELLSIKPGKIQGFNHFDKADEHEVDKLVEEADASDYDALLIPGGVGNPDQLPDRRERRAVRPRLLRAGQAGRGDLSRAVGARRGRRRQGPKGDLVAEPPDRHPERRREMGRRAGRGRPGAR